MSNNGTTRAALVAALTDLGDTATAVATTLARHNIRGVPNNGSRCAIVNWLTFRVPATAGKWGLFAGCETDERYWIDAGAVSSTLPGFEPIRIAGGLTDFLIAFDSLAYPHLVEAPAVAA